MSEQEKPKSFMQELDAWMTEIVIQPLRYGLPPDDARTWEDLISEVKSAIREKVLESYRNGCKAGAGHVRKEMSHAQAKTR